MGTGLAGYSNPWLRRIVGNLAAGRVLQALSPHFQVIAIDVRGHGRSDKPHDVKSYGLEMSRDVVRLMRHLGTPKAHIVGYSMGALVALDFAVLHQDRAFSVVLGGAGWNPPATLDDFRQQAEAFEQHKVPQRLCDDVKALAALRPEKESVQNAPTKGRDLEFLRF